MRLFLSLVILAILGICIGFSYFLFALGPVSKTSLAQDFEVKTGQGLGEISDNLKTSGLIRSKNVFKLYAVVSGKAHLLKPGEYILNLASGTPAILNELVKGAKKEIAVVIVEGMTLRDIEEKLSRAGILPEKAISQLNFESLKPDYEFLASAKSLEGYLFPDTYRFFEKSDSETVIRKFLDNFKQKAWPVLQGCQVSTAKAGQASVKCQGLTVGQLLILASLIEKEVPFDEDKRIVAGILLDRLAIGIPLQVDATISYAKCFGLFVFCENPAIKRQDLNWQSPYNTYLYPGLPAGPISNPGLSSIAAVLNPKKSEYLYYLSDPKTKKTIFSKTLDEHNDNRAKYLGT